MQNPDNPAAKAKFQEIHRAYNSLMSTDEEEVQLQLTASKKAKKAKAQEEARAQGQGGQGAQAEGAREGGDESDG